MQNQDNIEKLFKETFQGFEAEVNPAVWSKVQSGLGSGAGSGAAAAGKFALGKIIAAVVSVSVIGGGIWYVAQPEKKTGPVAQNTTSAVETVQVQSEEQNTVSEDPQFRDESSEKAARGQVPPAVRMLNHDISDRATETKNISHDAVASDASRPDNEASASSQPAPKYGNATKGDGGMMRGAPAHQYTAANQEKDNSPGSQEGSEDSSPSADIFVSTSSGDAPLTVRFYNHGTAASLNWNFDDGTSSAESSPTHVFEKAGKYEVTLVAQGTSESVTGKKIIEVKPISDIVKIPNVFTPNADGTNDFFSFEMKNISVIGVVIMSRRSGQVANWNTLEGNWDGKMLNGEDAPAGVYIYSIQAIGTDGVSHSRNGVITLER